MFSIEREQLIKSDIGRAWDFFSTPNNLAEITPKSMNFEILSDVPQKIYEGLLIEYKVTPIPMFRTNWVTKITEVSEGKQFVDTQLEGPYKFWHHRHIFTPIGKNLVLMRDIVDYELPLGICGDIAHSFFVKRKLEDIFDYRSEVIDQIFNSTR